ncbi:hypothetical protein N9081_01820 [Akkermansiaceae bacterium]|nr:hypothetical protein [Akkermansiaceae bacterium]MDB4791585.1 hypothetical protein [Akkermansiaceae bacterium]
MIRLIDERVMEKLRDKPENIDLEEFVPLVGEWREDKASKSKCPYCVEPIQKQATKCNHCLSEIEWFKFDGLYGPCKAGASEEMENALAMARATLRAAIQAEKLSANSQEKAKYERTLTQLQAAKCVTCKGPVLTSDELQKIVKAKPSYLYGLEFSRGWGGGYKCRRCIEGHERSLAWVFLVGGVLFIFLLWLVVR